MMTYGSVSIKSVHGTLLSIGKNGKVYQSKTVSNDSKLFLVLAQIPLSKVPFGLLTHHNTFVCQHSNGNLEKRKWIQGWERFFAHQAGKNKIGIFNYHKQYTGVNKRGKYYHIGHLKGWETFEVICNENGRFSFKSFHNKYVTAHSNGSFIAQDKIGPWEQFDFVLECEPYKCISLYANSTNTNTISHANGFDYTFKNIVCSSKKSYGIRSAHEGWVSVDISGKIMQIIGSIHKFGKNEKFKIVHAGSDTVGIQSVSSGKFLGVNGKGNFYTINHLKGWERFKIVNSNVSGKCGIFSVQWKKYVGVNSEGKFYIIDHLKGWEMFELFDMDVVELEKLKEKMEEERKKYLDIIKNLSGNLSNNASPSAPVLYNQNFGDSKDQNHMY